MATFDISAIKPVETVMPTRATATFTSPVLEWVRDSRASGKAHAVQVPADQVKAIVALLRRSAEYLTKEGENTGVSIRHSEPDAKGLVTISYQARERRGYNAAAR